MLTDRPPPNEKVPGTGVVFSTMYSNPLAACQSAVDVQVLTSRDFDIVKTIALHSVALANGLDGPLLMLKEGIKRTFPGIGDVEIPAQSIQILSRGGKLLNHVVLNSTVHQFSTANSPKAILPPAIEIASPDFTIPVRARLYVQNEFWGPGGRLEPPLGWIKAGPIPPIVVRVHYASQVFRHLYEVTVPVDP
jgi:hypothetical protein